MMNNRRLLLTILIALSVIAVFLWILVFIREPELINFGNNSNSSSREIEQEADFGQENKRVVISDEGISPTEVSVALRNSVIFENSTDQVITLDSDSEALELSTIEVGETYHTNLLSEPGEYTYSVVETGKEGRIIVNE